MAFALSAPAWATTPGANGPIAFRRWLDVDHTTSAIVAIRSDGTGERLLTHPATGTEDTQPDWSPDGRLVAFERCQPDTVCAIYTVRRDGRHLTRLSPPCTAAPPDIETVCPDESGVAFMPDGRHVVFTRSTGLVRVFPDGSNFIEHSDLVIRDLSGDHSTVVLRSLPFSGDNSQAVASPDGRRLAFQRQNSPLVKPAGATAVFVVDVDGRNLRRITPYTLDAGDHPDWSPDGRWILFRSNESGDFLKSQLYLVHPDGTGLHPITHLSADTLLLSASFSPDGRQIVYAQTGTGGVPDIFTLDVDGTHRHQVTRTTQWDSAPDWGPRRGH
jgi:Tol biopolymer transport system component